MIIGIDSASGRDWIAGQPGVDPWLFAEAFNETSLRESIVMQPKGADWVNAHEVDRGNAAIRYSFSTSRVFATNEDAADWETNILTNHAWSGSLVKLRAVPGASVPTWKTWSSANAVLQLVAISRYGRTVTLSYKSLVVWVAGADYIPSALGDVAMDDSGAVPMDASGAVPTS